MSLWSRLAGWCVPDAALQLRRSLLAHCVVCGGVTREWRDDVARYFGGVSVMVDRSCTC